MIVSHDALHFKEPVPDYKIVAGNEEGEIVTHTYFSRLGGAGGGSLFGLALTQGQGWENVGTRLSTGTACGRRAGSVSPPGCATGSGTSRCRWRSGGAGRWSLPGAG